MNGKLDFIKGLCEQKLRIDGRKEFLGFRDIKIEYGISKNAEGSVRVKLGKTEVLCGVKFGVGEPFPDSQDKGVLITSAEFSPIASEDFERGPPKEHAVELARVVDRGLRESGAIDFEALCIKKGEIVWTLFVDVYIFNHDGNLIDAAAMGAAAALRSAVFPKYNKKEGRIEYGEFTKQKLKLKFTPISVTFSLVGGLLLPDPCFDEEKVSDARLTITTSKNEIHSLQKGGSSGFSVEMVDKCVEEAFKLAEGIRKRVEEG